MELFSRAYELSSDGDTEEALSYISSVTWIAKQTSSFSQIDHALEKLDPKGVDVIILIAIMRNTYSMRGHLKNWEFALDRIESYLVSIGVDAKRKLRGLRKSV